MKRVSFALLLALLAAGCARKPDSQPPGPADAAPITGDARAAAPASPTLARVKARGILRCGVNPGLPGFAQRDERGAWHGFDVDFCRALAAAVLGDARKVAFVPLGNDRRIKALQAGEVDLLARNTTWTFGRDVGEGVDFAGVSYYDGQGFLAPRSLKLQSAAELSGALICVQSGTTSEANLRDWFASRAISWTPMLAPTEARARQDYEREICDVISADISTLASIRATLAEPGAHALLPEAISKEPLGPVVRQGDPGWTDVVRWTLNALILAEEGGVTAENAQRLRRDGADPDVRRLLGAEGDYGRMLGLDADWALRAIRAVGNYGEVFERNLGAGSALRLERGQNALWNASRPGLLYSPPMR